jgi:hypothetical protein
MLIRRFYLFGVFLLQDLEKKQTKSGQTTNKFNKHSVFEWGVH